MLGNISPSNRARRHGGAIRFASPHFCLLLAFSLSSLNPAGVAAQRGALNGEWPAYGGDSGSTKYSNLDQIRPETLDDLVVAWRWRSPDNDISGPLEFFHETTPLMVNGVLFTITNFSIIAAINPETGDTLWQFDPESYLNPAGQNWTLRSRGVAYWADGADRRILALTADSQLLALDADTGSPISSFGTNGFIDLQAAIPRIPEPHNYRMTSPPLICRDVVVAGSAIHDNVANKEGPPGDIRGFDVRTGDLLWTFHTIPRSGEFGTSTWGNDPDSGLPSWQFSGGANAWTPMSADEDLGYVYAATGCPTNENYGGHRPGDNLFANTLLCLDAETGQRVWHFQIVHHDIWDYDLPCAPILLDITVDGQPIAAVAQLTKQGFCFVFDRATGDPVWPINEVAVPQSSTADEVTSPTQPMPTKPPPFERQGVDTDELLNDTPTIEQDALNIVNAHAFGSLFTPPSTTSTILVPGRAGGANWGGGAVDVQRGRLFVSSTGPTADVVELVTPSSGNLDLVTQISGLGAPAGFPSVFKPPWGSITAYDMNQGQILWQVPNAPPDGVIGLGAVLATHSLLFFQNRNEDVLRAFDTDTGEALWSMDLGASVTGVPMTYQHEGKQYIVVAVGRSGETKELVALALSSIPIEATSTASRIATIFIVFALATIVCVFGFYRRPTKNVK